MVRKLTDEQNKRLIEIYYNTKYGSIAEQPYDSNLNLISIESDSNFNKDDFLKSLKDL